MKGEELLVTDIERTTKLLNILGERFTNHGNLLLPTFRQYEALETSEGLVSLSKDICRWLGYKPRRLTVTYGRTSSPQHTEIDQETITVSTEYRGHPLVVGGMLAMATIQFICEQHHFKPDRRFIELASIECGLSLWIINALKPNRGRMEKLYYMLDGNWLQLEGLQLEAMSTGEYLRQFSIFTSQNHLFPENYALGVSKRNARFLPVTPSATKTAYMAEPSITSIHIKNARAVWLRVILLSLALATISVCGILIWTMRTPSTPYDQVRDSESLRVIKSSLNECIDTASEQQSTYDPNDLFMTRKIDATKTRCESLRNQYNEALSQYETNYLRP